MVTLAMRTFVFAGLAGCGTRWVVLVEEFLESGQCLRLELDEVVKFSVVLRTYGIDEFGSGLENKVGRVSSERSDSIDVVSDAVACRLRMSLRVVVLENSFTMKGRNLSNV